MKIKKTDLQLFAEAGEAGSAETSAQVAEGQAAEVEEPTQVAAGEEKKASFEDLIAGEYKNDFEDKVKKIVRDRLKGSKKDSEALKQITPALHMLAQRYGLDAEKMDYSALAKAISDDDAYYENAAMEAGMEVGTYKRMEQMRMENARLQSEIDAQKEESEQRQIFENLSQQEPEVKRFYPTFDLASELGNPDFARLVFNNVPMRTAYEVVHRDDILGGAMQYTAARVEKEVTDNIKAGQARPVEQGLKGQPAIKAAFDPTKLTPEQREEIRRRVLRGERVTLG